MRWPLRARIAWPVAVALLLGVGWLVASARTSRSVIVINPLDQPVAVRFGDRAVTVPALDRSTASVPAGAVDVTVSAADGRVLDRDRIAVRASGRGQALYSVLGAAPVFRVNVVYSARRLEQSVPASGSDEFASLAPERFQVVEADYVLEAPPAQLEASSSDAPLVRTLVGLAPGGWRAALRMTGETGDLAAVYGLALRLHRALPAEREPLAMAAQLAGVLAGPEAAVALAEEATARAPDDPDVLQVAAQALSQAGRPAEAAALLRRLPPGPSKDVPSQVRALLAVGRHREALAVALAAARQEGAGADEVALYVRTARAASRAGVAAADPEEVVRDWAGRDVGDWARQGSEASVAWVKAILGDLPPDEVSELDVTRMNGSALQILAEAARDPGEALFHCHRGLETATLLLPGELALLLALEAHRTGDRDLYARLAFHVPASEAEVAAWIARGVEPADAWRQSDDQRAAFAVVRERWLLAAGQPVPPALAAAARADPLRGPAFLAATRWPRPDRTAPPAQLVRDP